MNTDTPACPYCASDEARELGQLPDSTWFAGKRLEKVLHGGSLFECACCHLKFRHPTLDSYDLLYDNAAVSNWSASTPRPAWDLISGYISTRLPQGGRVLDFGCNTGGLLGRLGPAYERYGVEINKSAAAVATRDHRATVWGSADDIPSAVRFDAIVASDVIEHVPDPGRFIDTLRDRLSEGGILIVTTGDADNRLWSRFGANWWYCYYPEHVAFISERWLDYYSNASGLVVEHLERFRYCNIPRRRRGFETAFTYFYGYFPNLCVRLSNAVRGVLRYPEIVSVSGNGVSADHLIAVLSRCGERP